MKIFKKIKIDKTFKNFTRGNRPQKSRCQGYFQRKTPPSGARGRIGFKFTFNASTSNDIPNGSSWHEKPKANLVILLLEIYTLININNMTKI